MRSRKTAFLAALLACCMTLATGATFAVARNVRTEVSAVQESEAQAELPLFNETTENYTLQNDYTVASGDNLSFVDGVNLDLGGNVLNLNNTTLFAAGTGNGNVTISNGTITGGTPVLTSGINAVVLNGVCLDADAPMLRLCGSISLTNSKVGTLKSVESEDIVSYGTVLSNATVSDITVDAGSVIGTLVADTPANIRIYGFVGVLYLTENAAYSYVELGANANVGMIYLAAENVYLNVDDDVAYIDSVIATETVKDTALAPDVYLELVSDDEMAAAVAALPEYGFVSSTEADCTRNGKVVLENDGKQETFTILAKHRYDAGVALFDGSRLLNITEYTCEYCGHVKRTVGEATRSVDECESLLDIPGLFIDDFNYDYTLDGGSSLGDITVDGGYLHAQCKDGKFTAAVALNAVLEDVTPTDVVVRAYVKDHVAYLYVTSTDMGGYEGYYDLDELLADVLDGTGVSATDLLTGIQEAFDGFCSLTCAQPQLEEALLSVRSSFNDLLEQAIPTAFWNDYLSKIDLFTVTATDLEGTDLTGINAADVNTYLLDLSALNASLTDLFLGDAEKGTAGISLTDFIDDYLYPVADGETPVSKLIYNFFYNLPYVTGEELVDAVVTLAENGGCRAEDLFDALNVALKVAMGEEEMDKLCDGDIRALVDGEFAGWTLNRIGAETIGVTLSDVVFTQENINKVLNASVASLTDSVARLAAGSSSGTPTDLLQKVLDVVSNDFVSEIGTFAYTADKDGNLLHADAYIKQTINVRYDKAYNDNTECVARTLRTDLQKLTDSGTKEYLANAVVSVVSASDMSAYLKELSAAILYTEIEGGVTRTTLTDAALSLYGDKVDVNGVLTWIATGFGAHIVNEKKTSVLGLSIPGSLEESVAFSAGIMTVSGTDWYVISKTDIDTKNFKVHTTAAYSENLDTVLFNGTINDGSDSYEWHQTDTAVVDGVTVDSDYVLSSVYAHSGDFTVTYTDTLLLFGTEQTEQYRAYALQAALGDAVLAYTVSGTDKYKNVNGGAIEPLRSFRFETDTRDGLTASVSVTDVTVSDSEVLTDGGVCVTYLPNDKSNTQFTYAAYQTYTPADGGKAEQNSALDLYFGRSIISFTMHADYSTSVVQNDSAYVALAQHHAGVTLTSYESTSRITPTDFYVTVSAAYEQNLQDGLTVQKSDLDFRLQADLGEYYVASATNSTQDLISEKEPVRGLDVNAHYYETVEDGRVVGHITNTDIVLTHGTTKGTSFFSSIGPRAVYMTATVTTLENVAAAQYVYEIITLSFSADEAYDAGSFWTWHAGFDDEYGRFNAAQEWETVVMNTLYFDGIYRNSNAFALTLHTQFVERFEYFETNNYVRCYEPETNMYGYSVDLSVTADAPVSAWKNNVNWESSLWFGEVGYDTREAMLADADANVVANAAYVWEQDLLTFDGSRDGRNYDCTLALTFNNSSSSADNALEIVMGNTGRNEQLNAYDSESLTVLTDSSGRPAVLAAVGRVSLTQSGTLTAASYYEDLFTLKLPDFGGEWSVDSLQDVWDEVQTRLSAWVDEIWFTPTTAFADNEYSAALTYGVAHTMVKYVGNTAVFSLQNLIDDDIEKAELASFTKVMTDENGSATWTWKDNLWSFDVISGDLYGGSSTAHMFYNLQLKLGTVQKLRDYNELYGDCVCGNTVTRRRVVNGTEVDESLEIRIMSGSGLIIDGNGAHVEDCNDTLTVSGGAGVRLNTDREHLRLALYLDAEDLLDLISGLTASETELLASATDEYIDENYDDDDEYDWILNAIEAFIEIKPFIESLPSEPCEWFSVALDTEEEGENLSVTASYEAKSPYHDSYDTWYVGEYSGSLTVYRQGDVYGYRTYSNGYLQDEYAVTVSKSEIALDTVYTDSGRDSEWETPAVKLTYNDDTDEYELVVSYAKVESGDVYVHSYRIALDAETKQLTVKINESGEVWDNGKKVFGTGGIGFKLDVDNDRDILPFVSVMDGMTESDFTNQTADAYKALKNLHI